MLIYALLCVVCFVSVQTASALFTVGGVRSTKTLHDECLWNLFHGTISFFNETPSGRIFSRFGTDLSNIDVFLTEIRVSISSRRASSTGECFSHTLFHFLFLLELQLEFFSKRGVKDDSDSVPVKLDWRLHTLSATSPQEGRLASSIPVRTLPIPL